MTTLIYKDGLLYGDRRYGVPANNGVNIYIDHPKIHTHESRQVAFGICGDTKYKGSEGVIGDVILANVIQMAKGNDVDWIPLFNKYLGTSGTLIVITKTTGFAICMNEDETNYTLVDLDSVPFFTVGSGQNAAAALLATDTDMEKVYPIISRVDGMTGYTPDIIKRSRLLKLRVPK